MDQPCAVSVARGPRKLIWPLTDRAQKHSFSAFSRRLIRRPVGVGLFWPGICIAKRIGVDVSGETAE